jgi:enolase
MPNQTKIFGRLRGRNNELAALVGEEGAVKEQIHRLVEALALCAEAPPSIIKHALREIDRILDVITEERRKDLEHRTGLTLRH